MEINKELRPLFHITGQNGWINDPNGLVKFNGKYHVFFQYYPKATHWGPMHWGHVTSTDLFNWKYEKIALAPGGLGDEDGCFSGSAIVHNDTLYLLYTGFKENEGGLSIRQLQCLASSKDGINFTKHGIVIGEDKLPKKYLPSDFRDPKVFKNNDTFYALVAAKKVDGRGRILLFKSQDLFEWEFVSDIFEKDSKGTMIECPDYISNLKLLLHSEQFQPNEGYTHLNIHSQRWLIGDLDFGSGKFDTKKQGIIDYGFDFYAPQTFLEENIMIGWLDMWDRNNPSEKYGFAGMLTCPRRLEIKNDELYQTPIFKNNNDCYKLIKNHFIDELKKGIIELEITELDKLEIQLRKKADNYFLIKLDGDEVVFDRSKCGEKIFGVEKDNLSLNGIRKMPLKNKEKVEMTIVMDEFSIEVFINGMAASFTIYPDIYAIELVLNIDSKSTKYKKTNYEE